MLLLWLHVRDYNTQPVEKAQGGCQSGRFRQFLVTFSSLAARRNSASARVMISHVDPLLLLLFFVFLVFVLLLLLISSRRLSSTRPLPLLRNRSLTSSPRCNIHPRSLETRFLAFRCVRCLECLYSIINLASGPDRLRGYGEATYGNNSLVDSLGAFT